ncbi:MAG: hypothetical protein ACOC98_03825 [Thermodesulfobacteriota bacterium]
MTPPAAERLAEFVRNLPEFVIYEVMDGNYNHIGATVADAILQSNNNYKRNVKPRIDRILNRYPNASTTSSVVNLLHLVQATEFLGWKGADRADRFVEVLNLFAAEGIEDEKDLRDWLSLESNLPKLRNIRGIGPKTLDYFKILVGFSTSAIDRHLLQFLKMAGIDSCGYVDAQSIINAAADNLGVDRAHFDHSIWQFMSRRPTTSKLGKCHGHRS